MFKLIVGAISTFVALVCVPLFFGAILLIGSAAIAQTTACTEEAADLIADQTINVGNVNVCNDDTTLTVTYEAISPWCLQETHLHVATSESDIPQTQKGNPKPGEFDYGDVHDCVGTATFEILLEDINSGVAPGDDLVIAAHAIVLDAFGNEETAWGQGTQFVQMGNWAMYFTYEVQASSFVFVTSQTFTGDLVSEATSRFGFGGSIGLDAGNHICNSLAEDAGLQPTGDTNFVAWLSDSTTDAKDRLVNEVGPYVLTDASGTVVADDLVDLLTCDPSCLQAAISVDESGVSLMTGSAWTGTRADGTLGLVACDDWSSFSDMVGGDYGSAVSNGTAWTAFGQSNCSLPRRLYCFEQ